MRMWARLRYGWLHDRPGSGGLALPLADAWRRAVEDRLDRLDLGTATTRMALGPSLSIVHVETPTEAAVPVALSLVDGLLDLPRWLDLDDLPSAGTTPSVRWRRAFDQIPPPERAERPEHELLPALVHRLIGRPQLALGLRAADVADDDARVPFDRVEPAPVGGVRARPVRRLELGARMPPALAHAPSDPRPRGNRPRRAGPWGRCDTSSDHGLADASRGTCSRRRPHETISGGQTGTDAAD